MKIYSYSRARAKLADVLEESKSEEIIIKRRKGEMFIITPQKGRRTSPFDVLGINKKITRQEIVEAIRESREGREQAKSSNE